VVVSNHGIAPATPAVFATFIEYVSVSVVPSAIVSVALVVGAVTATLLMLVAVAAPKEGVVSEILVAVVPLGKANTPVALAEIVALPLVAPFRTRLPPVPPFAPNFALLVPVIVVAATVPPDRLVAVVAVLAVFAVMLVLQLKPEPLVHSKALAAVEQDGTDWPVGATAVKEPRSWLADNAPVRLAAVVAVAELPPVFAHPAAVGVPFAAVPMVTD
jgi:hypothetical protein